MTPAGFDIASGLRGPDNSDNIGITLKELFTARLRWLTGLDYSDTGFDLRTNDLSPEIIEEHFKLIKEEVRNSHFDLSHFLSHIETASRALKADNLNELTQSLTYYNESNTYNKEYWDKLAGFANNDKQITTSLPGIIVKEDAE